MIKPIFFVIIAFIYMSLIMGNQTSAKTVNFTATPQKPGGISAECYPTDDNLKFCPNVSLSSKWTSGEPVDLTDNPLHLFISTVYGFVIGTIGIIATIMIMYGGFRWLTSRGGPGINEAKDIIFSALIGLALAFLSYTILFLINPDLTKIGLPTLNAIKYRQNFTAPGIDYTGERSANSRGGGGGVPPDITTLNDNMESTVNSIVDDAKKNGTPLDMPRNNNTVARPSDPNDVHGQNRAIDFPLSDANDAYFNNLIHDPRSSYTGYDSDGPFYYVTFPDGTHGRIGAESDCWHVDNAYEGEPRPDGGKY